MYIAKIVACIDVEKSYTFLNIFIQKDFFV